MAFCVWLLSFSMFSKLSMLRYISEFHPFMANTTLARQTTFCLLIHPLTDIWDCFYILASLNHAAMSLHVWAGVIVFSSLGYICPRVALLGHMVIVRLTFWGTARLSSSDGFVFTWNLYSFHKRFYKKMNFKKPQLEAQHCLWGIHPGHTLQGTPFSESSVSCPSLCP